MKYSNVKHWRYKLVEDDYFVFPYRLDLGFGRLDLEFGMYELYYEVGESYIRVYKGYAWDGATGPVIQTETTKKASLVHDVLCQAIGEGLLPESNQKTADEIYRYIAEQEGMSIVRRNVHYWAIRLFRPIWAKLPNRDYEKVYEI